MSYVSRAQGTMRVFEFWFSGAFTFFSFAAIVQNDVHGKSWNDCALLDWENKKKG